MEVTSCEVSRLDKLARQHKWIAQEMVDKSTGVPLVTFGIALATLSSAYSTLMSASDIVNVSEALVKRSE